MHQLRLHLPTTAIAATRAHLTTRHDTHGRWHNTNGPAAILPGHPTSTHQWHLNGHPSDATTT